MTVGVRKFDNVTADSTWNLTKSLPVNLYISKPITLETYADLQKHSGSGNFEGDVYQDGSLPHPSHGISCCLVFQYSFWYALLLGKQLCVSQLLVCYCTKFLQKALVLVQNTLILKQL